jgi:adenosine deaminase
LRIDTSLPNGHTEDTGTTEAGSDKAADDGRIALDRWVRTLPKAEVHLHLEGCLPPDLIDTAARRAGLDPSNGPPLPVNDLAGLLGYLDWACRLVDQADELAAIAYGTMVRAARSGVLHVDVIANPTHWTAWHGRLAAFVDALDTGFAAATADGLGTAAICLSIKRTQSAAEAHELVEWIARAGRPRVAALSIDGDEQEGAASHTERFRPAFERAAAVGLRRCAHAGESSGAGGVRDAIDGLGAERVDHGVRCLEDPSLTAEIARRGVPLDICPRSNVLLGVASSMAAHPVEPLRHAGVRFSLNTDDPIVYGIDLAGEYVGCAVQFGWGRQVLIDVARTSIESSFADEDRRRDLLGALAQFVEADAEPTAGATAGAGPNRGS